MRGLQTLAITHVIIYERELDSLLKALNTLSIKNLELEGQCCCKTSLSLQDFVLAFRTVEFLSLHNTCVRESHAQHMLKKLACNYLDSVEDKVLPNLIYLDLSARSKENLLVKLSPHHRRYLYLQHLYVYTGRFQEPKPFLELVRARQYPYYRAKKASPFNFTTETNYSRMFPRTH